MVRLRCCLEDPLKIRFVVIRRGFDTHLVIQHRDTYTIPEGILIDGYWPIVHFGRRKIGWFECHVEAHPKGSRATSRMPPTVARSAIGPCV